jgi:hypothetical protein
VSFLERQLTDPIRFARIKHWFYVGLLVVLLAECALALAQRALPDMFHSEHHDFWFDRVPAFGSLYGFVSCLTIIIVSKVLGKVWLMRRETYYDS